MTLAIRLVLGAIAAAASVAIAVMLESQHARGSSEYLEW